jgi:hypothetical protein
MKTSVSISPELLNEIMQLTKATTKPQAVEFALKTFIELKQQERIRTYRGQLHWDDNLDNLREKP